MHLLALVVGVIAVGIIIGVLYVSTEHTAIFIGIIAIIFGLGLALMFGISILEWFGVKVL